MAGSQKTVTTGLTCCSTQVAARARLTEAAGVGAKGPGCPTPAAASAPPVTMDRAQSPPRAMVDRCLRLAWGQPIVRRRPDHSRATGAPTARPAFRAVDGTP